MGGWGGGVYWPQGVPDHIRKQDRDRERGVPNTDTDQLARSYANLRYECADLEAIIGSADCQLSAKDLKRLDKAVTVMKVAFKIVARVLRKHGYETGRKKLAASADTLPKGRDAEQGSVRSKGSAVPSEETADAQPSEPRP